jgi:hypothetical protein
MRRAASLPLALAALVAAVVALSGCGADAHLQRQAAATRSTTCQSIIERQEGRPAPQLAPDKWLPEVKRPPKSLTETINEREIIDDCFDVQTSLEHSDSSNGGPVHLGIFSRPSAASSSRSGLTGLLDQASGSHDEATSPSSDSDGLLSSLVRLGRLIRQ